MYDEHYLLKSVIQITEERDKKSLIKVLTETLSDFIEFDSLIFLGVPRNKDDHLKVISSLPATAYLDKLQLIKHEYENHRVAIDPAAALCVSKREIIAVGDHGNHRTLVPVVVNNAVTDILDIYGHHLTPSSRKLIAGFIRIYSNFITIINDNEHDTLTGLLNRKTFETQLSELLIDAAAETGADTELHRRIQKPDTYHWAGILDIDFFKRINDTFGHVYGDEVLLLFADLMKKTFRSDDLLFRYGGEEFVVVLAPSTETDAHKVFERFRQQVESFRFPQVGQVTASIGFVKIEDQSHPTTVIEHADKALYYAKEHGRNQCHNYHTLLADGLLQSATHSSDVELF